LLPYQQHDTPMNTNEYKNISTESLKQYSNNKKIHRETSSFLNFQNCSFFQFLHLFQQTSNVVSQFVEFADRYLTQRTDYLLAYVQQAYFPTDVDWILHLQGLLEQNF